METRLIIRKETLYDKIRRSLLIFIYQRDYNMMQRLDKLLKAKRPIEKIIIPQEIGKNIKKYEK